MAFNDLIKQAQQSRLGRAIGTLGNRVQTTAQNIARTPVNIPKPIGQALGSFNQRMSPQGLTSFAKSGQANLFSLPSRMYNQQTPQTRYQPVNDVSKAVGGFAQNKVFQPFMDSPKNAVNTVRETGNAFKPGLTGQQRATHGWNAASSGMMAVGGLIPGLDDIAFGAYDAVKGVGASKLKGETGYKNVQAGLRAFSGEDYIGAGDAVTTNPLAQKVINTAELPLMLLSGKLRGGKKALNTTDMMKRGEALGIQGVSPRVNRVHPEDLDEMRAFVDEVRAKGPKANLGERGVAAQRLAPHYLSKEWATASNEKLAKAFEWVIDLNMNIPREARGKLPKLGIAADQVEQSVISQIKTMGLQSENLKQGLKVPEVDKALSKGLQIGADSSPASLTPPTKLLAQQQQKIKTTSKQLLEQPSEKIIAQAKKEIGTIADEPKVPLKQLANDFYTQWVDRFNPIVQASKQVEKIGKKRGFVLRPEYDPQYLVRRLTGAGGIADYRFRTELKPVIDEMESLGIDKSDMDVYLKARRDIGLSQRGILGSDAITAQERLGILEQKYGKNLDEIAQKLYQYQNKGFQELIDSGFLSPEGAAAIRKQNPDYVPFERVMEELDNYIGVPSQKAQQGTQIVKKIKGSERQIYSPIESIIANTFKQRAAVEKNRVANSIVGLQQVAPDLGFTQSAKSGPDTITVWKNGQKQYWKVGTDIAEATKGLNEESMNALLKIFSAPANLLRQGATGRNPDFMLPNVVRDQIDAAITSKYGYIPFVDYARGLSSLLKNDEIYQKFQQSGAKIDFGDIRGRQSIKEMFNEKTARKGLFKWLGQGLDQLGKYSEEPTRVGLFKKAYQKTGNELLATMESRDATVDFSRMGSKMKVANSIIPFLNVQVQGFDKLVRSIKNNPGKIALTMGAYGALPQISSTLYNLLYHPEEYGEIPQYEKDSNFIFISGRNEDGTVNYATIPKGNVVPLVANPIQAFLEYTRGQNSQTFAEFATQFLSSSVPVVGEGSSIGEVGLKTIGGLTPQLFKPMAEVLVNKSFYKYDPNKEQAKSIVPEYLNKKPAGERDYEWTPAMYKGIGRAVNISPLQVQSVMEGYLAGYAKIPAQIVQALKNVSEGKGIEKNETTVIRRFFKQTYPTTSKKTTQKNVERSKILAQASASEPNKERAKIITQAQAAEDPKDIDLLLYKDSITKINNYKENKTKAEAGLVDKGVEEYQAEFDEAMIIKRELEKKYSASELLSNTYLKDLPKTPPNSKYEKSMYEDKVWDRLGDVDKSALNEYEKTQVRQILLKKIGIDEDDYEYYSIAKQDNDPKTLYAYDQLEAAQSQEDFYRFLADGRKPVRGEILVSNGVIDNLVDDGIISKEFGQAFKNLELNPDGSVKPKKIKGKSGRKASNAKAVNDAFEDLKRIRIQSPKIRATSGQRINTKGLTFSGA